MRKLKQATQREKARRALKEKDTTQSSGEAQPRGAKAGSAPQRNGHAAPPGDPDRDRPRGETPSSKATRH
jgi:hypothetical protein